MTSRHRYVYTLALAAVLAGSVQLRAQEPDSSNPPQPRGWRRVDETQEMERRETLPAASDPAPPQFVLPAGTWITVRVNEPLSSDQNRSGDAFTASLAKPLVVNGYVVARRGQTVEGRIAEAQKAGKVKGTSRLGIELTEIGLVDGQQLPVRTQLIEYSGGTSAGRDATAVATTAGLGAAIGAVAEGGFGAGIGAIAGAAAGAVGVLVTRGRPTVVYPEGSLTFRTLEPLTISTDRSAQAFLPVRQADYEQESLRRRAGTPPTLMAPPPPYYYYGYPYPPYFYGTGIFIHSGRYFYHGRGFHRRW